MKMTWHVVHDLTRRNDDMTSNICHRKQGLQLSLYTLTRKGADYTFWWNEMPNWFCCCCCCCCLFSYLVHCNSSVIIYVPSTKDSRYILSFAIWDSWKKHCQCHNQNLDSSTILSCVSSGGCCNWLSPQPYRWENFAGFSTLLTSRSVNIYHRSPLLRWTW